MFFVRKARKLNNQEVPIYMRITVDGERAEISIKRSVKQEYWNEVKGSAKSGTPYAKELNFFLEQIRHNMYEHQQDLNNRNKVVTATSLKNAYLNIGDDDHRTLLQAYDEHNATLELLVDKGVSKSTYIRHTTSKKHLERFIQSEFKKNDVLLRDVDHSFIVKYETYLRAKRDCNNNTTVKYIRNLGKIIREAMRCDQIKVDPFRNLKFKTEEVDKPFLNLTELDAIVNKKLELHESLRFGTYLSSAASPD